MDNDKLKIQSTKKNSLRLLIGLNKYPWVLLVKIFSKGKNTLVLQLFQSK